MSRGRVGHTIEHGRCSPESAATCPSRDGFRQCGVASTRLLRGGGRCDSCGQGSQQRLWGQARWTESGQTRDDLGVEWKKRGNIRFYHLCLLDMFCWNIRETVKQVYLNLSTRFKGLRSKGYAVNFDGANNIHPPMKPLKQTSCDASL
jgi:hypothetical protein